MFKVSDPEFKERILSYLKGQRFMLHNNMRVTDIQPGRVTAELSLEEIHHQQFGRVHGGVITTLADIVAGFAAYTLVDKDTHVVTGEIKVSFFRPAKGKELKSIGTVIKTGTKLSFCEAEVYSVDNGNILIAKASTTMIHIPLDQG